MNTTHRQWERLFLSCLLHLNVDHRHTCPPPYLKTHDGKPTEHKTTSSSRFTLHPRFWRVQGAVGSREVVQPGYSHRSLFQGFMASTMFDCSKAVLARCKYVAIVAVDWVDKPSWIVCATYRNVGSSLHPTSGLFG